MPLYPHLFQSYAILLQMMKQLNLTEGDPVSVRGAKLPKGKMVKLQAQTVDFLEVADPKAA